MRRRLLPALLAFLVLLVPACKDDEADGTDTTAAAGTALAGIAPGTYAGTIDTAGAFRDGVSVGSAEASLTVADGGASLTWSISWTEDAGECTKTGVDSFSGDELVLDDAAGFSLRGARDYVPGGSCDLGAEASSTSKTFRLLVDGTTVTADIGLGIATFDVG